MLRIVQVENGQSAVTLRLAGRVVGPWVEALRQACDEVLGAGARLILDLADVSFVDLEGAEVLWDLRSRSVSLAHCSVFLNEQLGRSRPERAPS